MEAKILIVDDNPLNIELLEAYLTSQGYMTIKAFNGLEALEKVGQESPDLILLDVMMPEMDGYEVCRRIKNDPKTRLLPVIMLTALHDVQDRINGIEAGADDFISKPFNNIELLTRVKSLLRIKFLNDELEDLESILFTLAAAIDAKDPYTKGHSERVAKYAELLGAEYGLPEQDLTLLRRAGLLHDIGKIGVSGQLLNKPEALTNDELIEINRHSLIGADIIRPLRSARQVLPIILHHHEKWDGSGQPEGLSGENIPLLARILTIADIYDALVTDRPYRSRMTMEEAIGIIESESGMSCDPEIVKIFTGLIKAKDLSGIENIGSIVSPGIDISEKLQTT